MSTVVLPKLAGPLSAADERAAAPTKTLKVRIRTEDGVVLVQGIQKIKGWAPNE